MTSEIDNEDFDSVETHIHGVGVDQDSGDLFLAIAIDGEQLPMLHIVNSKKAAVMISRVLERRRQKLRMKRRR